MEEMVKGWPEKVKLESDTKHELVVKDTKEQKLMIHFVDTKIYLYRSTCEPSKQAIEREGEREDDGTDDTGSDENGPDDVDRDIQRHLGIVRWPDSEQGSTIDHRHRWGRCLSIHQREVEVVDEQLEEMMKEWPEKLNHKLHCEHELLLTRRDAYNCDGCEETGYTWSYNCNTWVFDLHPKCALKNNEETNNDPTDKPVFIACIHSMYSSMIEILGKKKF
ncbi:hypothetical protein FEM48_ZijujUnG0052500 [Ziziphus jujuba var. spinosa]|uniref:DC1 domain-containing protein n=1 Tax=Ziziphus jujuba var. spinosa TaxID=714518 RepID=A0A978U963_ZIZJJ|nr:hypothetical protein FEM48_ZijujUnG0052500 [Ziziphus jujuba var. spinosa]